jgi:hypothetical protein
MDRFLNENDDMFYKRIQFDNRLTDIADRVLTFDHKLKNNDDNDENAGHALDYDSYLNSVYPDRALVNRNYNQPQPRVRVGRPQYENKSNN